MSAASDIESLRYVLQRDPASPLFYELAAACYGAEQWAEAERVLCAGLSFHAEHLGARVLLGQVLARTGRAQEAKRELEAAAEALGGLACRLYPELAAACEEADEAEQGLASLRVAEAFGAMGEGGMERRARFEARLKARQVAQAQDEARALLSRGETEAAAVRLREALGRYPQEAALAGQLQDAEAKVASEREAGRMISLLQGWLHSIKQDA